jgi:MOSC domain-containing protein YiiM
MAKLVSLNRGIPRDILWHDKVVSTGIFKEAVSGRVAMRRTNLDGDRQADLTVHGGVEKAVYCYPHEHYAFWERDLGRTLPMGMFGENLTTAGLDESSVHAGDEFEIGSARVVVTQPRMPCYKLGIRFDDDGMVKRFMASGRSGFYVAVVREGEVGAGDDITLVSREVHAVSIPMLIRLYVAKSYSAEDAAWARRALQVASITHGWKEHFGDRLAAAG